jgi:hypothetical protein
MRKRQRKWFLVVATEKGHKKDSIFTVTSYKGESWIFSLSNIRLTLTEIGLTFSLAAGGTSSGHRRLLSCCLSTPGRSVFWRLFAVYGHRICLPQALWLPDALYIYSVTLLRHGKTLRWRVRTARAFGFDHGAFKFQRIQVSFVSLGKSWTKSDQTWVDELEHNNIHIYCSHYFSVEICLTNCLI